VFEAGRADVGRSVLQEEWYQTFPTGICYDNAVSESTFATYKKELIHTRPWPTMADLKRETDDWIKNYFNTPTEYELGYRDISQLAA
jgi:putative transposase